ncbi:MAG TPA: hypothetical protein VJR89_24225, partial [Polyangiales bacterium]|nr:hypothetical protein [Polyangiales bacterium]
MLVYRHPYRELAGDVAKRALLAAMGRLPRDPIGDCALEALLRAGEIECALADLGHEGEPEAARVTDAMASHVLVDCGTSLRSVERALRELELPARLRFRTPAGYAHHALDPRQYAALAERIACSHERPNVVLGIRSIGTSLGAIVGEALKLRGFLVQRRSVRPKGHPWARVLLWSERERAFVDQQRRLGAQFLIVDEGPHASGSTFLAVADALESVGVAARDIALCASRMPSPSTLLAKRADERWTRYRCYSAAPWTNVVACEDLSAGAWRKLAYGENAAAWPACWTQLERVKRLSPDGRWLDKFEGLAPYRDAGFERACVLAQAGYAPPPTLLGHGFVRYPWLGGRPARASDLNEQLLRELARYCAFRLRALPASEADTRGLARMLRTNLDEAFGVDIGDRIRFDVERAVVPDARLQPFEFRIGAEARLIKTDGHLHGDGPLLPGPTDICWDLAGTIVEWGMNRGQIEQFLSDYTKLSGDRPERRLPAYLLGYCAQRLGEMYVATYSASPAERVRLQVAQQIYRTHLERWLQANQ